jgi:hypothetical protein
MQKDEIIRMKKLMIKSFEFNPRVFIDFFSSSLKINAFAIF